MTYTEAETALNGTLAIGKEVRLKRKQIAELEAFKNDLGGEVDEAALGGLWTDYARAVTRLLYAKYETARLVRSVLQSDRRLVLEARYVLCLKWEEVADLCHYSLVHVYRLAKAGVEEVARRWREC